MGKEVSFTSIHSLPPGTEDIPRDLGTAELNSSVDLQTELLRAGWAKTKELKRDPTDEDIKRQELEEDARKGGRGMWRTSMSLSAKTSFSKAMSLTLPSQ